MKKLIIMSMLAVSSILHADDVYSAIATVESNNNDRAVGDNGNAVGRYQIWKIYVDDVNRISNKKYTYADRYNAVKSLEMVKIYTAHYCKRYERITGKKANDEIIARIHNGGLNGWKKQATVKYWNKVNKEMNK